MRRRQWSAIFSAAILAVAVAACDSSDSSSPSSDGSSVDNVAVGVIAIVDVAPIYLGKEKGFFSKRNINLTLTPGSGGAVTIAGAVSGQFQFGFANVTSLLVARDQNLPLKVVANGNASTGKAGADFSAVVVRADSPIHSAKDLPGRTVSVNNLKNIGDTTVRASVRKAGGDPSKVKFLELPLPDMTPALIKGNIDAAWVVEPFLTVAKNAGARPIAWNMVDAAPNLTVATYFTTEKMIGSNPGLVKRFTEAINESLEYAGSHESEVRAIVRTYTQIAPDLIDKLTLPIWSAQLNRDSIQQLAILVKQDGLVSKDPNLNALLP